MRWVLNTYVSAMVGVALLSELVLGPRWFENCRGY